MNSSEIGRHKHIRIDPTDGKIHLIDIDTPIAPQNILVLDGVVFGLVKQVLPNSMIRLAMSAKDYTNAHFAGGTYDWHIAA